MNNWLLEFSAKRAMDIEERLHSDPQFQPIRDRLVMLKQNLITPGNFRAIKEIEGLEDAVISAIKDEFYMQGLRDGMDLREIPQGLRFGEYYRDMAGIGGEKIG